jgi:hypothetical protein
MIAFFLEQIAWVQARDHRSDLSNLRRRLREIVKDLRVAL